jgi:GntR family transcriptional regulator, transcriptional repressor for pyruvate dehydrogenase complex
MNLLYMDLVTEIKKQIRDGDLQTGQKLPSERDLAIQFNVSRNVVREATSVLQGEGLISVHAGKGAFVTEPNPNMITGTLERIMATYQTTVDDILEVREELEVAIIKKAVKASTSDDIKKLYEHYDLMEKNKLDVAKFVELDVQFHIILAKCTKNPLHYILLNSFIEMTQQVLFAFTKILPESVELAQKQHLDLIKAIENIDEAKAVETIHSHMQVLREEIKFLREKKLI